MVRSGVWKSLMIGEPLENIGKLLTGSVDGEKNAKNNVNNKLINICFNSKLTI